DRGILSDAETDLQLYGAESFRGVEGCFLRQVFERIARFAPVEAGRIGLHLAACRAAEELMRGHAKMLALDVPQRDVDAAQALDHDALLAVVAQARIDYLPQQFGAQRILAD